MEKEMISVIIPVYNVERFLPTCLDSVLAQSYRNFELILVDDGSTDSCGAICNAYAVKDPRIVVIHKTNGGLSDARNAGLRKALGEYITFIDSDDYVHEDYLSILHQELTDAGADIAYCDCVKVDENATDAGRLTKRKGIVSSHIDALKQMYHPVQHGQSFIACGKLYRRKVFEKSQAMFPVGKIHEDIFTTYQLIYAAQKVVFIPSQLYCYRKRAGSIMNVSFSRKRLDGLEARKEALVFFGEKEDDLRRIAANDYFSAAIRLYDEAQKNADAILREECQSVIVKEYREMWKKHGSLIDSPIKTALYAIFGMVPHMGSMLYMTAKRLTSQTRKRSF